MEENKRISDLFDRARNEAPKISVEKTTKHFLAASAVGGAGILAKWAAASFKFKAIVMTATLSTLTISGILISTQLASPTTSGAKYLEDEAIQIEQNFEILSEDGVQKTTIFDENDKVIQVIIDSSENKKWKDQTIDMSVKEPELLSPPEITLNPSLVLKTETSKSENATDPLTSKKFKVTENTTSEELENIMKQARKAGIDFDYETQVRKGLIKKMTMNMTIKSGNNESKWSSKITGAKSFSFEFGWEEDESGKAISLIDSCNTTVGSETPERPEVPEAPERPEAPEKYEIE